MYTGPLCNYCEAAKRLLARNNVDDMIWVANNLNENVYENSKEAIEENWRTALDFVYYEQNIFNLVETIFKYNKII